MVFSRVGEFLQWAPLSPRGRLATFPQTIAEKIVQFRYGIDLLDGRFHIVGNPAESHDIFLQDDIAGFRVSIARLADTPPVAPA